MGREDRGSEGHLKVEADWSAASTSHKPRTGSGCHPSPEDERGARNSLSKRPQGTNPVDNLILGFWSPEL